jgi:hypothetical protein
MPYLDNFLDFLASPYGLVGFLLSLFILTRTHETYRRLHWFLFALCGFAASLIKYTDPWEREVPALAFPLEQLRNMGRPLAIFILGLLLLVALRSYRGWRSRTLPNPVPYLIVVQIIIVLKTLQYGSIAFALLTVITFGAVILMITKGPSRWLQDERNFQLGVWSIALVGIIFAIANLYQASINIYSIMFLHGLFWGTTGNPQHAATLLTTTVPCCLFFIQKPHQSSQIKWFWLTFLILAGFTIILTGSRTGVLSSIIAILLFYRYRGGQFLRLGLTIAIILLVVGSFLPSEPTVVKVGPTSIESSFDQITSSVDTRTHVWQAQWRTFMNHPILGAPLRGERFRYGESSWLGTAAALGLVGFIPLVLFGVESLKMMFQLDRLVARKPQYYLHCSVVIAGIGCLLAGSFTEAYLLGNITFPLLALLLYQALGTYLLDLDRKERKLQQSQAKLSTTTSNA